MTTYSTIADSEIDPESALTVGLMTKMRDNPIAITEGASGAPKIQTAAITDGAVTSVKIANGNVTSAKIAAGNVGTTQLASGERMNTSNVTSNYASVGYTDVGCYVWCENNSGSSISAGATIAAGSLDVTGVGTYRCMTAGGVTDGSRGLFLRIS